MMLPIAVASLIAAVAWGAGAASHLTTVGSFRFQARPSGRGAVASEEGALDSTGDLDDAVELGDSPGAAHKIVEAAAMAQKKKIKTVPKSKPVHNHNGLVTAAQMSEAARVVLNLEVHGLRFGAKGCRPILKADRIATRCEIGGKLRFDFKPNGLDPVKLIKGLEYVFATNRSSVCSNIVAANCTSTVGLSEFAESPTNDATIVRAITHDKPSAPVGEQKELTKKIKELMAHQVRMVGEKTILTMFS